RTCVLIINYIKADPLGRGALSSFRSIGKTVVIVVFLTLVVYASLRAVEDKSTLLNELKPQNKPTLENKSTLLNELKPQNKPTLENKSTQLDKALRTVDDKSTLLNDLKPQNKPTLENKSTQLDKALRAVEDESTLQNKPTQLDKVGNQSVNNENAPKLPQPQIFRYLNCSDLHKYSLAEDTIQLSNLIIEAADNPCIIKASVIILKNNHFPSYNYAYNITGKKIVMVNNEFRGPQQNHYIVGDNVLLVNNTYQGHLQVHEVAGYEVTAFNNVYDGICKINQYSGTSILVFDNESRGDLYDVLLRE
ncbi:uncharacterized protein LOC125055342, partial [Pieris napi]|uniref:uncharacterized protein LOC125055342 n=1 Tax=Pieris napi TaxID=78633 RepID=UPI001FBAB557